MTSTVETRIKRLGLELPVAPPPASHYLTFTRVGELVMTSGQLPWERGSMRYPGRIPSQVSPQQGYEACRLCAINALAQLRTGLGALDMIERIVRVEMLLHCDEGFFDQSAVADGASDLFVEVFGERGRHVRTLAGISVMPFNACAQLNVMAHVR